MQILKKIRQYDVGPAERRAHAITRQASKYPRKPLTMKQLREIPQKRYSTPEIDEALDEICDGV